MTRVLRLSETGLTVLIEQAAAVITGGGIVAYPTETFYGLGVRYNDRHALARLFSIKRRSGEKATPLIIGDRQLLERIVLEVPHRAGTLMDRFWPGPLTLLLPARPRLPRLLTARTGKVAVRVPGESFALHLARSLPFPITATSANISGERPADNAEAVISSLGHELDLVIDCGKSPGGSPSTIVDVSGTDVRILRVGAIPGHAVLSAVRDALRHTGAPSGQGS